MDRRTVLALSGAALMAASQAEADDGLPLLPTDTLSYPDEVLTLWPGKAPGDLGTARTLTLTERSKDPARYHDRAATGVTTPDITVFRPARPDGSAILLMPGGGYNHITVDKEGTDVARVFNRSGITCFVLRYRLPPEGWADSMNVPLQDAQRAMRLIRARAADFHLDPARLGLMGFSAGGHMASTMSTWGAGAHVYAPVDAVDQQDDRPAFAGLIYAGVMMGGGNIEPHPGTDQIAARAPLSNVTAQVPPTFMCQNIGDPAVPVLKLVEYFEALHKVQVPCELHLFEKGGHGFGIRDTIGMPNAAWPDLFVAWGRSHGFFRPAS